MDTVTSKSHGNQTRLRAMIEIIDGEIKVYPIANSDSDEKLILDRIRVIREDDRR